MLCLLLVVSIQRRRTTYHGYKPRVVACRLCVECAGCPQKSKLHRSTNTGALYLVIIRTVLPYRSNFERSGLDLQPRSSKEPLFSNLPPLCRSLNPGVVTNPHLLLFPAFTILPPFTTSCTVPFLLYHFTLYSTHHPLFIHSLYSKTKESTWMKYMLCTKKVDSPKI